MATISDTLTMGLVLILVFGSLCLYLYTRIQQAEAKINLLESILLDLKMTNELKSYPDIAYPVIEPITQSVVDLSHQSTHIKQFVDINDTVDVQDISEATLPSAPFNNDESTSSDDKIHTNYEAMTTKELQVLAKQRGITGVSSMRRAKIIEALNNVDSASPLVSEPLTSITE
jgi:ribosomal protein L7/L12